MKKPICNCFKNDRITDDHLYNSSVKLLNCFQDLVMDSGICCDAERYFGVLFITMLLRTILANEKNLNDVSQISEDDHTQLMASLVDDIMSFDKTVMFRATELRARLNAGQISETRQ